MHYDYQGKNVQGLLLGNLAFKPSSANSLAV